MRSKARIVIGLLMLLVLLGVAGYLIYDGLNNDPIASDTTAQMSQTDGQTTYMSPALNSTTFSIPMTAYMPIPIARDEMFVMNTVTLLTTDETEAEEESTEETEAETTEEETETTVDVEETEVVETEVAIEDPFDKLFITNDALVDAYLNVRDVPGGEVIAILNKHAGGHVLSYEDGWAQILSGSVLGYVDAAYIIMGREAVERSEAGVVAVVNSTSLTLRSEPNENSTSMDILTVGQRVPVISYENGWVNVVDEDMFGYVKAEYVYFTMNSGYAVLLDENLWNELAGVEETEPEVVIPETQPVIIPETQPAVVPETQPVVVPETQPVIVPETQPVIIPETAAPTVAPTTVAPTTVAPTTAAPLTADEKIAQRIAAYANSGQATMPAIYPTAAEVYLMACVITLEDGYGSAAGQLAIANVITNRLRSGIWGNTVPGVIYAPGQFYPQGHPVLEEQMRKGPFDASMEAALQACAGINNIGDYMFFCSVKRAETMQASSMLNVDGVVLYKR